MVWTDLERAGGEPLEEFLEGFPPMTRKQAVAVLEAGKAYLIEGLKAA